MINFNVIREQPDSGAGRQWRATINPVARYWLLESPLSNLQRYFSNVAQCEQFARSRSPAGSMLVSDAEGSVDRRIEWGIDSTNGTKQ